jgi:hypothetical protein
VSGPTRPLLVAATLALVVIGSATSAPRRAERGSPPFATPAAEVERIRAHFDSVLVELAARGAGARVAMSVRF